MELKYIWITEFGVLKQFGANFNHTGLHRFEYQGDRLALFSNDPGPLNFSNNVTAVSAIVGQNGTGKSTLCQAILSTVATVSNGIVGYNRYFTGIVCFGVHIFHHEGITLSNQQELEQSGYTVKAFKESPLEDMGFAERQNFVKNSFIYYSNQFDPRNYFEEVSLANISTEALVFDDRKYSTAFFWRFEEGHHRQLVTEISHFALQEYNRMATFLCFCHDFLPMRTPEALFLINTYLGNNRFFGSWENMLKNKDLSYWSVFHRAEEEIFEALGPKHQKDDEDIAYSDVPILESQYRLYRLNVARILLADQYTLPSAEEFWLYLFRDRSAATIGIINYALADELLRTYNDLLSESSPRLGTFKPQNFKHFVRERLDWRFYLIEYARVPNTGPTRALLRQLIMLEKRVLNPSELGGDRAAVRITNLSFPSILSSGEYSFLALFSRLYDLFNRYRDQAVIPDNVVLFIDEAEVGFHPAWSKHLFHWILDFLGNYGKDLMFQLILTTHSPYLLSDLPSENVILMRKNGEGRPEIIDSGKFQTFGGNVYELLSETFFLQDGAIGEFAKEKIQAMIDKISRWRGRRLSLGVDDRQAFDADGVWLSRVIPIVADNIIRGKLLEMYNEVFAPADITDQRIRELQREIDNLKNSQK